MSTIIAPRTNGLVSQRRRQPDSRWLLAVLVTGVGSYAAYTLGAFGIAKR